MMAHTRIIRQNFFNDPLIAEKSPFKAFLNMPGAAYYLRVKGSYSFNNILIEYKQLGPEYKSFGNPYLTTNLREFIINDRLSLLGRRLMIVAAYKYRDNKLSDLIAHPIATRTISLNSRMGGVPKEVRKCLRWTDGKGGRSNIAAQGLGDRCPETRV